MNTIKLLYTIKRYEGGEQDVLVPRILVDGSPFHDEFTVDIRGLVASVRDAGEFYIFTCGCGEPFCAGLAEGVHAEHGDERVTWRVADPITQDLCEEPPESISYVEYSFDRNEYLEAVRVGLDEARAIVGRGKDIGFVPYGLREEEIVSLSV